MDLLLLRLIADWPPGQDPAGLVRQVQDAAAPLHLNLLQPPRPYWKSEGQIELQFSVSPAGDEAQRALAARAAEGWDAVEPDGEASRVWNRHGPQVLLHPAVRWAELGRVPAAALPGASDLVFEPLVPAHADELFEAFADETLYTFIPQRPPRTVEALRAEFADFAAGPATGSGERWWNWVVRCVPSQVALGTLQATRFADGALWVGYKIAARHRGRGIATRGLRWVLQQLAAQYPGMAVQASVDTRHAASLRVLHKCGFTAVRTEDAELHGVATRDLIHVFVLPGADLSFGP